MLQLCLEAAVRHDEGKQNLTRINMYHKENVELDYILNRAWSKWGIPIRCECNCLKDAIGRSS